MGSVPVPMTWTTGMVVTAADLNTELQTNITFLLSPPRVVTTFNASYSMPPDLVPMKWNESVLDTDSMWALSPNPSRLVANTPGRYSIVLQLHADYLSTAGEYFIGVGIDTAGAWGGPGGVVERCRRSSNQSGYGTSLSCWTDQYLNAGDYFECFASQTTGADVTVDGGTFSNSATVLWIGAS